MALNIKTDEADRLARELVKLTGESLTDAVTVALRERLARQQQSREPGSADRIMAFSKKVASEFDRRPVSKAEWDWASGDED